MKNEIEQLLSKYKNGNNIHEHEKQPHEFVFNLSQRLDLRSSNNMLLFKTYLFITPGKKREQYKNNKLKIIALT